MVRRIVTTTDSEGASAFLSDGPSPWQATFESIPGFDVTMLWATDENTSTEAEFPDKGAWPTSWVPGPGGSRLLLVTFPPDSVMLSAEFDGLAAHTEQMEKLPGLAEAFEAENPGMHKTASVDYGVVLSGRITLELDNERVRELQAHDVVVQRGTRHAWRNPAAEPASVLFVLLGAGPAR